MRIGTDLSIETCRAEGYMVMDFPAHKFKKEPRTTDCRFTVSYPDYIREEMGWSVGDKIIYIDIMLNWNDLWEMYQENKKGIDSFIGSYYDDDPAGVYNMLHLASDINAYCGLV